MSGIKIREFKETDEKLVTRLIYDDFIVEIIERFNLIIMKGPYFWVLCTTIFALTSCFVFNTTDFGLLLSTGFSFVGIPLFFYVFGGKILVFYYVYVDDHFPDVRRGLNKFWIQKQIPNMKMWVLTVDDVIAGVIALRPINVESVETHDDVTPSTTDAMLTRLVVRREFRGRGLAKTLMTHTINFAREQGYELIHLLTTTVQTEAVAMYRKLGWREVNRSPILWLAKDEYVFEFELDVRDM